MSLLTSLAAIKANKGRRRRDDALDPTHDDDNAADGDATTRPTQRRRRRRRRDDATAMVIARGAANEAAQDDVSQERTPADDVDRLLATMTARRPRAPNPPNAKNVNDVHAVHDDVDVTASQRDDDFRQRLTTPKGGRKVVDGLLVYTEDELRIGQGGGTKDCPFDCWCCY